MGLHDNKLNENAQEQSEGEECDGQSQHREEETVPINVITIEFEHTPESEEIFNKASKKVQVQMMRMLESIKPKAKKHTVNIPKAGIDEDAQIKTGGSTQAQAAGGAVISRAIINANTERRTEEMTQVTNPMRREQVIAGQLEDHYVQLKKQMDEMRRALHMANVSRRTEPPIRKERGWSQHMIDGGPDSRYQGYSESESDNETDEEFRERSTNVNRKYASYPKPNRAEHADYHDCMGPTVNMEGTRRHYERPEITQPRQQYNVLTTFNHLATIPVFDGDSASLPLFEKMVRMAARTVEPDYESFFVGALANRLKGKAGMYFAPRLTQFETVDEFLNELARRYGNVGNPEAELAKLRGVHQRRGESLESYCNRVELIFNRVTLLYDSNPSLRPKQKVALKISAEQEAMKQFRYGLGMPYSYMLSNTMPDSLSQAIVDALQIESDLSMRYPAPDREARLHYAREGERLQPYEKGGYDYKQTGETELDEWDGVDGDFKLCLYCNKYGPHSTRECRKLLSDAKNGRIKDPDAVAAEPQAKATTERLEQKASKNKQCEYCKRKNHSTGECYTLLRDIREGRIGGERRSNANARPNLPTSSRNGPRFDNGRKFDGARQNNTPHTYPGNNYNNRGSYDRGRGHDRGYDYDRRGNYAQNRGPTFDNRTDGSRMEHLNCQDARRAPQTSSGPRQ